MCSETFTTLLVRLAKVQGRNFGVLWSSSLPRMSHSLAPGAPRLLTIPATILHWGQSYSVVRLAIRSPGILLLPCLHRSTTQISRLGWPPRTGDTGARMAAPRRNASALGNPEDLRLGSLKLQQEISHFIQGGDVALGGTEIGESLVKKVEAESTEDVEEPLGESEIGLAVGKLDKVGGVGNLQAEAAKDFGKLVGKSETELDVSELGTGRAKIVGNVVGKSEAEAPKDFRELVGKLGTQLDVGKLGSRGEEIVGKVAGNLEDEDVGKVLVKSAIELDVANLDVGRAELVGKAGGKVEEAPKNSGKVVGTADTELEIGKLDRGTDTASSLKAGKVVRDDGAPAKAGGPESGLASGSGEGTAPIYISEKYIQHLQSLLQNRELKLPAGTSLVGAGEQGNSHDVQGFDADVYFAELSTLQYGNLLLFSTRLPSTHMILSQNFRAFPLGTVCVADVQYQGKGRGGNVWESPKGCLMFSFTLQLEDGRTLPFLQYVVSLAVIEGIGAYCSKQGLISPDVRIKWPNDLYANGLKVGGVLCTSTYSSKKFNIVVGVGLNVSNRQPTTCLEALIEELNPSSHAIKREQLLAIVFSRLEELLFTFSSQGFSPLEASYYGRWLHSGQKVELEERQEDGCSIVPVTIQALTTSGFLLATDEKGDKYELHPDGNSFDFLKGLVRKKLSS